MKPAVKWKFLRDLDVHLTTLKTLLSDGNGNGIIIRIRNTNELYASGYFRESDQFYLIPVKDLEIMAGIPIDKLQEGSRIEIGHISTEKIPSFH